MRRKNRPSIWAFALLSILLQVEAASAANILAFFAFAGTSHNTVYSTVTKALAQKGHHLTVVTSKPIDSPPPNYHQIDVHDSVAHNFTSFNKTKKVGTIDLIIELVGLTENVCTVMMQKDEIKALIKPKVGVKFDLILISNFYDECLYPFAHIYNAPIVLISPGSPLATSYSSVGNVALPSYFAEFFTGYNDRMTFKERTLNTVVHATLSLFYKYYVQRSMECKMRSVFGEDIPPITELMDHVSLVILNNHFSLNPARPTVPCLIEAGGLHITSPKELPKDLKTFLDGAGKDGVIYFCLGSILKSSSLSKETRDAFIMAFSKVKQKVLWKWEGESPIPGQSKNVRLEKWLPQQDVLAHPNVKLFISHGGLLSYQEAASRGVPLIGIPHFGDQELNMKRVLDHKVGVKLDPQNLTARNILSAIKEVLENPIYAKNMKRIQSIMLDQKEHPLERAVYWIEYVLRHDGAKHLKPAAFYLPWWQIYLLDVLCFLAVISLLVTLVVGIICVKGIKKICRSRIKDSNSDPTKKTQ